MKRFCTILFCLLSFNFAFSQNDVEESSNEKEWREKVDDAFYLYLNDQYAKALPVFKELVLNDINNANFNYLTGICYLKLPFENGNTLISPLVLSHPPSHDITFTILFFNFLNFINYRIIILELC